jgi:hypothetical protein
MSFQPRVRLAAWLAATMACSMAGYPSVAFAVSQDELIVAFQNIRSDNVPHNAETACAWVYAHRDELTPELLDELYRTDRQGRDVILYALMRTKTYNPDARFCQTLVSRLNEEDRFVGNGDLGLRMGVHHFAWTYMDRRYELFKPLLLTNLQTTNDMFCIWGTVCLLQKHGDLPDAMPKFDPHVWDTAAISLAPDDIEGNAGQAIRFYLVIGTAALPHLQPLTTSKDFQTRNLSSATVDALGGNRKAYGYLAAHVCLDRDLFSQQLKGSPEWLGDEARNWTGDDNEAYK